MSAATPHRWRSPRSSLAWTRLSAPPVDVSHVHMLRTRCLCSPQLGAQWREGRFCVPQGVTSSVTRLETGPGSEGMWPTEPGTAQGPGNLLLSSTLLVKPQHCVWQQQQTQIREVIFFYLETNLYKTADLIQPLVWTGLITKIIKTHFYYLSGKCLWSEEELSSIVWLCFVFLFSFSLVSCFILLSRLFLSIGKVFCYSAPCVFCLSPVSLLQSRPLSPDSGVSLQVFRIVVLSIYNLCLVRSLCFLHLYMFASHILCSRDIFFASYAFEVFFYF